MIKRIRTLIRKELIAVIRDRRVRFALFVPPVIQLFLFTFAATLDVKNATMGVLNRDGGEESVQLIQRFYGTKVFSHVIFLKNEEEIRPFLDEQRGLMVLSIDAQFSRDLAAKRPATVQLLLDGRKSNTAQIVAGYAATIIQQFRPKNQRAFTVSRTWFNPNRLYFWYNIPCLVATLSMLTCLVVTAQSVARERELGTFDQLLVSPLTPFEILMGKTIPGIMVGLIEGTVMLAAGTLLLGVPFTGSLILYYISLFIFVTSVSGIGLFVSSLAKTQQQAMLGVFIFMIPCILLSGFATPIENMPAWLQPFSYLFPLRYMLIISKGLFLKAMPAHIVFMQVWPLIIISCFTLTGAGWFFRRRLA